jgi:hypothetical protein
MFKPFGTAEKYLRYASAASFWASEWWLGALGGAILAFSVRAMGWHFLSALPSDPILASVVTYVCGVLVGFLFVFGLRLSWAPFHFSYETRGGLWKTLRSIKVEAWHLIVAGSLGVILSSILFFSGVVWHLTVPSARGFDSSKKLKILPNGAKFELDDQIYWSVAQPYIPKEAAAILEAAEDLDNYYLKKSATWLQEVANSVPEMFGRIKDVGGPRGVRAALRQLDEEKLIPLLQGGDAIRNDHATFRTDLESLYPVYSGSPDDFRGTLHKLEKALEIVPDDATPQVVDALTGNARSAFLAAVSSFRTAIWSQHTKLDNAKPELRRLAARTG